MLKKRLIPCLDVKDGRVVKGVNFLDLVDAGDPVEQARLYDREGADELCFLDITASHEERSTLYDVVGRTADQCFMPVTVGGGAPHQFGVARGCGTQHDAINPERQPVLDCGAVADAATELDAQIDGTADRRYRCAIDRAAGDGAVEVDEVQPGETGLSEMTRLRRGIPVEDSGGRHVAMDEAHAGAVLEVDRREQDHGAAG